MTAPSKPTENEIREKEYRWEYDTYTVDVHRVEDPPGSRPPLIQQRRRIVSDWEAYNPD